MQTSNANSGVRGGFFSWAVGCVATLFFVLFFSLFFSVIFEWVGMTFFWKDAHVTHAKELLVKELGYLNQDFRNTLVAKDSMRFAKGFADKMYHFLFEKTGIQKMVERAKKPLSGDEKGGRRLTHDFYQGSEDYILSAFYTTQTYAVRLAVLVMAMPLFAIFFVVGLTEGLVRRDLRRWRGGRESSLVYAYAKRGVWPTFIATWWVYLSLPVSCHPNFVILPFGILFGVLLCIMAASFKKYV
ncbi:MAG: TIGR03747 family integrating conjugative element membrane protein [Gammaproteobacteria bacterium]|nr:TIGR03747 family integrating conjugative element membrane protein [Gammaproteobacteria bacterium]